jgi:hypothetical protein
VIVRDQNGDPFPGATVTFSVGSGGGSVIGGNVTTDVNGVAAVGQWTLGTGVGLNSLTAHSGSLSLTFTTNGVAGPAARLVISAGNSQTAPPATRLPTSPTVVVEDANGNPKEGVIVTFAVASGGGSVTGATATSNVLGVATVGGWTLGPAQGPNTLTASAAGAPSVTFNATAVIAKCSARTAHTLGGTSTGTLESDDCQFTDGSFVDFFSISLPSAGAYLFRQSGAFDTYLDIALNDGTVVAENDDAADSTNNSAIKALLPAGTYLIGASSFDPRVTGSYSISSQATSTDNSNCELVFVMKNVTTTQALANDCQLTGTTISADAFYILLRAGESVTVTMSSTQVDSYLQLVRRSNAATVAENDNRDATTSDARMTFTASVTDYYAIVARTASPSQTGAYTLSIQ